MIHKQYTRAPTVTMLRKAIKEAEGTGETFVSFEYGEQYSRFERHGDRWYHYGNGLLKAGYKLDDELTKEFYEKMRR